jgi:predicted ribosome quality control (RQC) complex YloA/Tae2 family protein
MAFTKTIVRTAVILALVGGTAAIVVGPDRLGALFDQTQNSINNQVDKVITDPVALRAQMRKLEGEYPERLAEVRRDLAELQQQKAQLVREREVSVRVVELAESDMSTLQAMIERGEQAQQTAQAMYDPADPAAGAHVVKVVFNNQSIPLKEAYGKATRIQQVHTAYTSRANDIDRDMGYLEQQEQRLTDLLSQLETEYTEFQSQVWQMDRQVDSIARNERLIDMMEKRQRTLDEQGRYKAHSLDQLAGRFADIRARQEARLESLGTASSTINYEDRAKFDIDAKKPIELRSSIRPSRAPATVIEITPADVRKPLPAAPKPTANTAPTATSDKSLALGN